MRTTFRHLVELVIEIVGWLPLSVSLLSSGWYRDRGLDTTVFFSTIVLLCVGSRQVQILAQSNYESNNFENIEVLFVG